MTGMPSYVVENPSFGPYKPKKQHNLYSSLLPILLSIFTYILIFYVLDASPSSIFNDTKVLFFISNALIIIIAVDYGAFTVKEKHDFYGEYTASMGRENHRPDQSSSYGMSIVGEVTKNREKQEEAVGEKNIPRYLLQKEAEVTEKTVQVVRENQLRKYVPTTERNMHITAVKGEPCNTRNLVNSKPYRRSKSDKARGSMITKERRRQEIKQKPKSYDRVQSDKCVVVHKSEEATKKWENVREESEEFSKMSNEELNRRVEDFIQRFNRDIKRQSLV